MPAITYSDIFTAIYESNGAANILDMCEIETNKFVITWIASDGSGDYNAKACVAVVSGNEIYFGTVKTVDGTDDLGSSGRCGCCVIDNTGALAHVLFAWHDKDDSDKGKAAWAEIGADNSITVKTVVDFEDCSADPGSDRVLGVIGCAQADHGSAVIFYRYDDDSQSDNDLYAVGVKENGNSLTVGTPVFINGDEVADISYSPNKAFRVNRNQVCAGFIEGSAFKVATVLMAENEVIYSGTTSIDAGIGNNSGSLCRLDYNKLYGLFSDSANSNTLTSAVVVENWTRGADELGGDGDMADAGTVGNWTGTNATLSSTSGGQSGNCMKLLENGGADPTAHYDLTLTNATDYEIEFFVKAGDEATWEVEAYDVNTAATLAKTIAEDATSSWVRQRLFFTAIDSVNATRIILRQKCDAAAGTYVLFDEVTVKSVTGVAWATTQSTSFDTDNTYCYEVASLSSTLALASVRGSTGYHYFVPIAISGTSASKGTAVVGPFEDTVGVHRRILLVETSGNVFTFIAYRTDAAGDMAKCVLGEYQLLPTATGYCKIRDGNGSDKGLRLIAYGDADYNVLKVRQGGNSYVADLIAKNPPFTDGFPVRVYHETHGVLCWRDDSAEDAGG